MIEGDMAKTVLDVKGLLCPLPVLKAKKQLRMMQSGDLLEVMTTDPGAVADFQCLCTQDGLELVSQSEDEGLCVHLLKKI